MTRQIALLRGINLGPRRRIAMPELRELLSAAGFADVRTYVQSGNVVLSSDLAPERLEQETERLIAERFGFPVEVVARTRNELADVIHRNPLAEVATEPKRYQVTFLRGPLEPAVVQKLEALDAAPEQLVVSGRELYSWHPAGVGRSRLWSRLASAGWLSTTGTARNWTTVQTLLKLADEEA
jgi:uncharacterized protein (DUF1697 family)